MMLLALTVYLFALCERKKIYKKWKSTAAKRHLPDYASLLVIDIMVPTVPNRKRAAALAVIGDHQRRSLGLRASAGW
jgi:hypothetical protein